MNQSLTCIRLTLGLLGLVAVPVLAQPASGPDGMRESQPSLDCTARMLSDARFCEVREESYKSSSHFTVEGVHNGTLAVHGWNRDEILVRMRVEAEAGNDEDSVKLADQVETNVDPTRLKVRGPNYQGLSFWPFGDEGKWTVSVELFVPHEYDVDAATHNGALTMTDVKGTLHFTTHNGRLDLKRVAGNLRGSTHNGLVEVDGIEGAGRTDLELSTHNGGIDIRDVHGRLEFSTHNGSVDLTDVAGNVSGSTHNGQIRVTLAGDSFASQSLDLGTHNGAIRVRMPANFAAHVDMRTHNGHMDSEFPTVPGRFNDRKMEFDVGGGGPTIRLATFNGPIDLEKR